MMRIPNNGDYQLWFHPGHAEAPRPLQGYEYLQEVIMTHLQHTYSRVNSKNSTAFPLLPGLLRQDLNLEGQFILKPRYSAISQQQKSTEILKKKERTYRTRCFPRAYVPHEDQGYTVPKVKKKGKLFGRELNWICKDGKWPTEILDILSVLREKGPTAVGIFSIAPSDVLCKGVKEKLDSGQKVNIRKHSVHLASWILKEFLQMIKGSLLTSQLYEHWLSIPEMVSNEEKLSTAKRLLEELPPLNAAFLRQMFRILNKIARNSSINHMPAYSLSAAIAPFLLCLPRYGNKVLATDISKKISLVTFLIDNSPKLFGLDIVALWYETSFYHGPGGNTSCDQVTTSNIITPNEPENGASSCPKGRTYTPEHDEPTISQVAPPLSEGTNESETQEDNMNATQQTTSQTPTAPPKNQVFRTCPRFICLDKMLPSILDMISVIAEKGPESEEVFQSISDRSHLVLRDKIYTEQHINWDQESVLTVAYLLKDFIRNIQGSLLYSDLYENWLSVLDEESLLGKISTIRSILLKMPQANYIVLKQLIRVLLKIKTSAKNTLDSFILSIRIAPHVLWDQTCVNSLFGSDIPKKISVIQIMIDNFADIFGEDDPIICDNSQKRSDDIKTTVNTAAGDNETTATYDFPQRKLPHD
ncbi:rho GTPase-activating protein 20-like isoform X4 [Apodemus sylvaticus]|uniref:rho GTPase-activating protein 20-like isoform X3 n=1 Tax=Apodemus sylvaticus TaxID=10129 RepID=UPI002242D816|nr:rho GTPase-activating protein 20-like isoform X3 [Apodemus sylvaticus]XP_052036789.1 rho GTPase-activating protein 20-like isoform X4 [Apodemus sylvaticus]